MQRRNFPAPTSDPPRLPGLGRSRPGRLPRSAGITLIEMLVVLAILTAVLMIGMPALLSIMNAYALGTTAEQMAMHVRFARHSSVKEKQLHRVSLRDDAHSTAPNTYEVQEFDGSSWVTIEDYEFSMPEGILIKASTTYTSSGTGTINLDSRGGCTAGQVYLEGRDGREIELDISPTAAIAVNKLWL